MVLAASLPFDVLAIVCEFLTNTSDVSPFSLICSSLRPIATRRLLSMRPIYLIGGPSVLQFHSFLFADTPARAPHVRALHIDLYGEEGCESPNQVWDEPVDTPLLVDTLTSCPRIECILIAFDSSLDVTTGNGPRIIRAIASLSALRSLPLRPISGRQASPRARCTHCNPASLARHISHLAPALEELDLGQFTVDPDEICAMQDPPPDSDSRTTPLRGTAVRSLAVEFFGGKPLLKPLQHLFPALDRTFSMFYGPFTSFKIPEDKYARLRAANLRAQESGGAWAQLDRVTCDALVFYVLGLRRPVRLAMLDVAPGMGSAFTSRYAAAALREHPIPRLKLSLMLDDGLGVMFDGLFDSPAVAETLTHLTLCLVYDGAERAPGSEPRMSLSSAKQNSALKPLRSLTHLGLVHSDAVENKNADDVRVVAFARALRRCRPTSESTSESHEREGAGEDAAAVLARALPSLQYVFLTVSGHLPDPEDMCAEGWFYPEEEEWELDFERWRASQAWRVARPHLLAARAHGAARKGPGSVGGSGVHGEERRLEEQEVTLVELHEDVAEGIIWVEELVLPGKNEMRLSGS